jgi:hypothetical protein
MSPPSTTHHSNEPRGRHAVVFLRDGRVYEGDVLISDRLVHFEGRLRVGRGGDVSYRAAGGRVWPQRELKEIRYTDQQEPRETAEAF